MHVHSCPLVLQLALGTMRQLLLRFPCPRGICGSDCTTQDKVTADGSAWDCRLAESNAASTSVAYSSAAEAVHCKRLSPCTALVVSDTQSVSIQCLKFAKK